MICQWRADQLFAEAEGFGKQIIDLRDTGKSLYFAITELNNCFIIRSPSFWSTKYVKWRHSLPARGNDPRFSHKSVVSIKHEQNIICIKTLICRQFFAGYVVSSRSIKRKGKIRWMIMRNVWVFGHFFQILLLKIPVSDWDSKDIEAILLLSALSLPQTL